MINSHTKFQQTALTAQIRPSFRGEHLKNISRSNKITGPRSTQQLNQKFNSFHQPLERCKLFNVGRWKTMKYFAQKFIVLNEVAKIHQVKWTKIYFVFGTEGSFLFTQFLTSIIPISNFIRQLLYQNLFVPLIVAHLAKTGKTRAAENQRKQQLNR